MIRTVLHGADFHLDSPFSGLSPEQAARRRQEQRGLLDRLVTLANEEKADVVLLSGDLLDGDNLYRETAQTLARTLGSILCPVMIAAGNHDYLRGGRGYDLIQWPENVHIFTPEMEKICLPEKKIVVYGRSFVSAYMAESPLNGLNVEEDDSWLKLMCVHGDVGGQNTYGPITLQQIEESGLDYLALGHVHRFDGLKKQGRTWWAYPGSPEGRGFDETGEKGVLILQAEPGQVSSRFVSLAHHKYEWIRVDVSGKEPLQAVMEVLPGNTEQDIYRIELVGSCACVDLPAMQRNLAPKFYSLTIRDHTRLPVDLWEKREEDSLTGLFLRCMWDKCQKEPENECYQLAVRFGLAALENGEDVAL